MAREKHGLRVKFKGEKAQTVWFSSSTARDTAYNRMKADPKIVYARKVEKS